MNVMPRIKHERSEPMRAVLIDAPGGADGLYLGEHPKPSPTDDELLVRVTALNRADLLQREGKYPPPEGASPILGLEMAGVVEEVGTDVQGWATGERVCALLPGGGYAEYAAIPHPLAMPVPEGLSFEEAAAIPEVFLTAFQALCWIGGVQAGERVLIHAGASGVGTAAIQLAKAAGAYVMVTASGPKLDRCRALGADVAIDYQREDFAARVREATGGHGADVVLDFVGAPYFEGNLEALALDGRLVLLAMLGGSKVGSFDLRALFKKRASLHATTLRARPLDYKIRLTQAFAKDVLPRFANGTLRPVIDRVYDWADVRAAHERMEANANVGKIVLRVG